MEKAEIHHWQIAENVPGIELVQKLSEKSAVPFPMSCLGAKFTMSLLIQRYMVWHLDLERWATRFKDEHAFRESELSRVGQRCGQRGNGCFSLSVSTFFRSFTDLYWSDVSSGYLVITCDVKKEWLRSSPKGLCLWQGLLAYACAGVDRKGETIWNYEKLSNIKETPTDFQNISHLMKMSRDLVRFWKSGFIIFRWTCLPQEPKCPGFWWKFQLH